MQMIVEKMNILTTLFLRYDNLKITIPNGVLASKAISNYRRSPDMEERIDFSVHIATPIEKIDAMKQRITRSAFIHACMLTIIRTMFVYHCE